jgi:hypothetical protein
MSGTHHILGRSAYIILVKKPEGKRLLGRCRHRWEDNFRMDLRAIGYENVDCFQLAQNRVQCYEVVCERANNW